MKRYAILILCLLCGPIQAANEINAFAPGVTTTYAVVREIDGDVWYVAGQVFEAWGTAGRTAADYDIALTDKAGDMFVGDMDGNISAGYYHIVTHYQAAGAAADTDPVVWAEYGYWSGTGWTQGIMPDFPTKEEIRAEIDANSTQLAAIRAVTDVMQALNTTVNTPNDANNFTVADGNDVNDAYVGMIIYVQDATTGDWESRMIEIWETGLEVTVDTAFSFTPEAGDVVIIWGISYIPPLIYNQFPLPRDTTSTSIDRRVTGTGGGTVTLDEVGDDP